MLSDHFYNQAMKISRAFFIALALSFCFPHISYGQQADGMGQAKTGKIVHAIEVRGNRSISIATILSKIKTRVGQDYRQTVVSDDLKRLYNTGYFSDVKVDREDYQDGYKVFIDLTEKPVVEEITFSKTRYLKKRLLLTKMKSQEGKFLDNKSLNDDINTIEDMYAKKGLTQAEVEVEKFIDDITNKATLHFIIREGQRLKVKRINVLGNTAFHDKRIVKAMKSRWAWWLNSAFLKEDVIEEDMSRIEAFYESNGYIDARAAYTIDYLSKGRVNVNVTVDEGPRYYVGTISITGNKVLTQYEIERTMQSIGEGNVYSRTKLEEDVTNIQSAYFDKGYIFAKIDDATSLNPRTGKVDLKLNIAEGGVAYINKVKIQGNTQTRDVVIRRELRMFPGDQFDGLRLRRSKERLRNLGYFEDVAFDLEDANIPDHKNLIVEVKEAKTGSFSFGGGYSTVDEVVGFIELEQRNFDITNWPNFTGGGQRLSLRAETGSTRNNLRLSFLEPWVLDYPVSFGFDIFKLERDRERDVGYAYDEDREGFEVRLGKSLTEYIDVGASYRLEDVTIGNIDSSVTMDLLAEEGSNTVSSVGFSLVNDHRDSSISPTKGWILRGSTDVAGLGGDKDFYRIQGRGSYFVPMKWESVLEFRGRIGMVKEYGNSTTVPIFERFFAGGSRSIRGYDERKVGPIDSNTNDPLGGEALVVGNLEYTIPVMEFLKLAAFYDVGNVWAQTDDFFEDELRSGTGLGLRIKTPIGPVNLDYGYPLSNEPGEESKSGKFYFSVSRGF